MNGHGYLTPPPSMGLNPMEDFCRWKKCPSTEHNFLTYLHPEVLFLGSEDSQKHHKEGGRGLLWENRIAKIIPFILQLSSERSSYVYYKYISVFQG